jgi:hypothetical protein
MPSIRVEGNAARSRRLAVGTAERHARRFSAVCIGQSPVYINRED